MKDRFQIELGSQVILVVAPEAESKLEILALNIAQSNGAVQIVGGGATDAIGLVGSSVGHSILLVDIKAKAENGGIEHLQREINVFVNQPDEDQLSLFIVPPGFEQLQAALAPETTNDSLAKENAGLKAEVARLDERVRDLQEMLDQSAKSAEIEKADVGKTSENVSGNVPEKVQNIPKTPKARKPAKPAETVTTENESTANAGETSESVSGETPASETPAS